MASGSCRKSRKGRNEGQINSKPWPYRMKPIGEYSPEKLTQENNVKAARLNGKRKTNRGIRAKAKSFKFEAFRPFYQHRGKKWRNIFLLLRTQNFLYWITRKSPDDAFAVEIDISEWLGEDTISAVSFSASLVPFWMEIKILTPTRLSGHTWKTVLTVWIIS